MAETFVTNYAELKTAIVNPAYDVISLANNINYDVATGVQVPRNRGDFTINGNGYTLTDYNALGSAYGIYLQNIAGDPITVTVRDISWVGRNYYGLVWFSDNAYSSNATFVLDNVTYVGPQPIYNRYGKTIVRNSTFTLTRNGSASNAQEFCETNRLEIEGKVDINSDAPSDGCIWLTSSGVSMYVHPDAELNIYTSDSYIFYFDGGRPTIEFGANSKTYIQTYSGFYLSASNTLHTPESWTMREGSSFIGIQFGREYSVPTFKVYSSFVLEPNTTFVLATTSPASSATSQPLFRCNATCALTIDNPQNFVLYSNGGNLFSFNAGTTANPNRITFNAEMVNNWVNPTLPFNSAGGIDDIPTNQFKRQDGSNVSGVYTCTTTSTVSVSSNLTSDDVGYPMNSSNFSAFGYKVLSMGRLPLVVDKVQDISTEVTGRTDADAEVRLSLLGDVQNTTANASGGYSFDILPLPVGTVGTVGAGILFLRKFADFRFYGSVSITHTEGITFRTTVVPHYLSVIKRVNTDMYIEVTDTREQGNLWWKLYASLPDPLENNGSQLVDALHLVEETDRVVNETPIIIATGYSSSQESTVVTRVSWNETHGFLLYLQPSTAYPTGLYSADINWQLEEEE